MSTILAFETALDPGSVCILDDGGAVSVELTGARGRALLPAVRDLLSERGLAPRDIGAIAVSAGPGSYTGIRVGVTAAKTLAWALRAPLVAVSTLEAMAVEAMRGAATGTGRLAPAVDAGRGLVYSALFAVRDGMLVRLEDDAARSAEEFGALCEAGDFVFGKDAAPHAPSARSVAEAGLRLLENGERADPFTLTPRYLREWASPAARKK